MSQAGPTKQELEAKVAKLEHQMQHLDKAGTTPLHHGWRKFFAAILILLAALTITTSLKALWLRNTLFDTPTWTRKMTQIIQNPSVRTDLSNQLVATIFTKVNVQKYVSDALPKQAQPLVGPLTSSLQKFTADQVNTVLGSEAFITFWQQANTSAHTAIVKSLEQLNTSSQAAARNQVIFIDQDHVVLNTQPIITELKTKLVDAGLSFVSGVNTDALNTTFTLATIQNLPIVLAVVNTINGLAFWLPLVALLLAAIAIYVSTNRRRALVAIAITTAALAVIDITVLRVGGVVFAQTLSTNVSAISSTSAQAVYRILTGDLHGAYVATTVVALLVTLFGCLAGPSSAAIWVRQHLADLFRGEIKTPTMKWLNVNATVLIVSLISLAAILVLLTTSATIAISAAIVVGILSVLLLSIRLAGAKKKV